MNGAYDWLDRYIVAKAPAFDLVVRLEELVEGLSAGRVLSDVRFDAVQLSEAPFAGLKLSRGSLRGANFRFADLSGSAFEQTDLAGADFIGARLDGSAWSEVSLERAVLQQVQAEHVSLAGDFGYAQGLGAGFFHSTLSGNWNYGRWSRCEFTDTALRRISGYFTEFERTQFTRVQFDDSLYSSAKFNESLFLSCVFRDVRFQKCDFRKARFMASSERSPVEFQRTEFDRCDLRGADLRGIGRFRRFIQCDLEGALVEPGFTLDESNWVQPDFFVKGPYPPPHGPWVEIGGTLRRRAEP